MQYFKNSELAKMFNVSQAAVGKWVVAAKSGKSKLKLNLVEREGKSYIANTPKNLAIIEEMVTERKKYFNKRSLKVIEPRSDFYELFTNEQILDIISNIDIHREIPLQYTYFNGGADYWDNYILRLSGEETPNFLSNTINLLKLNQDYLDELLVKYKKVNVVDIGAGNGYPVKGLLADLLDKGKLGRYMALDVSQEMLNKVSANVDRWFEGKVNFEGYIRDINYDRFVDLLAGESFQYNADETVNLVLFLGGTLSNFRNPGDILKVIYSSMGKNDYLIYTGKLDSPNTRLYFDINTQQGSPVLSGTFVHRHALEMLNINEDYYEVVREFDPSIKARFIRIRFKVAVSLKFKLGDGERSIDLYKGETILVWRAWHRTGVEFAEQFDRNGFNMLQASETPDHTYLMMISEIKVAQTTNN